MQSRESHTVALVLRRFGWFFFLEVFLNTLDRANVSFAAFGMSEDLGFDPKIYGFGVSMFFVTYILFQMPLGVLIDRLGSRRVLATIMILWGAAASLTAFVETKEQFYAVRLLLGAAEAGAPAALGLYAARWVPERSVATFMTVGNLAFPAGVILGAPLSGLLLGAFEGQAGWPGWRWMFLLEGAPTILLGVFAFWWLQDSPRQARWLSEDQRAWLTAHTVDERRPGSSDARAGARLGAVLRDLRLWRFGVISFTVGASVYGLVFWLPQVLAGLSPGASPIRAVVLSAVPWMGVAIGMVLAAWNSDRVGERHWHLAGGALVACLGLAAAASVKSPALGLAILTFAGLGVGACYAVMWPTVIGYLKSRPGMALSLGFFNVIANVAGVAINSGIGWLRVTTGSFAIPLYALAGLLLSGMALTLLDAHRHGRRLAPVSP